jgi:DNA-binding PadR family transcriptional regulator
MCSRYIETASRKERLGMHRHHHFHDDCGPRGRRAWSGLGGRHGRFREGRFGRFLEHGDLRFVVLALLAEEPRHGYELIKALEDRTGGAYRPSPGVIYPLLALLEDEGLIRAVESGAGRKAYEITDDGRAALDENRAGVEAVFGRMDEISRGSRAAGPRVGRAMANLGMALAARMRRDLSEADIDRIVGLLDETAVAIEKL